MTKKYPQELKEKLVARMLAPDGISGEALARESGVSASVLRRWRQAAQAAERAVPAGAVYWFEGFSGDPGKLAEWVAGGLWGGNADPQRRAEGFNNAWLAAWPQGDPL